MKNLLPSLILSISIIAAVLILTQNHSTRGDKEIRAAYEELNTISGELVDNPNNGKIKEIVSGFASQVVGGFKGAFDNSEEMLKFKIAFTKVTLSDVKFVAADRKNKEKIIGIITNDSNELIKNIKITIMAYDEEDNLIDVTNSWLSEVKILQSSRSIGFAIERSLGEYNDSEDLLNSRKATKITATISSFDIVKI